MHAIFANLFICLGLAASDCSSSTCPQIETENIDGNSLMQKRQVHVAMAEGKISLAVIEGKMVSSVTERDFYSSRMNSSGNFEVHRSFLGASPAVAAPACAVDTYAPSSLENQWMANALEWTASHCSHMDTVVADTWISQNEKGNFGANLFSTLCRSGQVPQYIEPLAGILRDPRFACNGRDTAQDLFSLDWLVFPSKDILTAGAKARFYDAGGSTFGDALHMFLKIYKAHGIVFDEVYVWEFNKQGNESYWRGVDAKIRAFWEPRVTFYDGIGVTAEKDSEHNPVSRIFGSCAPQDFCSFKLDIDTPQVEFPLVQQLLSTPAETQAKLDEFFFEHHVEGFMQGWWGSAVNGTFTDSYRLFAELRKLGVRAHSWV